METALSLAWGLPGYGEILLIVVVVLVVFGRNRIPELGASLGKGIRNFKNGLTKPDPKELPDGTAERSENQTSSSESADK